ncbi:MAG: exodeoxyribonuclease III [Endomicrobiales bacterium]|nr:exodeoxyribonuclease III [Endomicrobiales bacterium]
MKICTFNVNSIRTRKDLLIQWLMHRSRDIDVLCVQETKCVDTEFPSTNFKTLGYNSAVSGQKSYNGVAIFSKPPLLEVKKGFGNDYLDQQKRFISAKIDDITIINIYAPHGDERGKDKFNYKLDWYDHLLTYLKQNFSPDEPLVITGDLNVTRGDIDIHDPEAMQDIIGTMPEERAQLEKILEWGLKDSFRELYPEKQGFTWWDYVGGAVWTNKGMRLDYVLCTAPVLKQIKSVEVDTWPRKRREPKPSDHAPLIATL